MNINVDNLNNVRRDAGTHFRNKKEEYLRAKIEELETKSKIKNINDLYRGIIDTKKGYQLRTNIVKGEKSDLVPDSHSILARWRKHFSQLLNVHGINDVEHTEIHTSEPLALKPSAFQVELAIERLKSHKSTGTDQITAKLINAWGRTNRNVIHKLISIWNKKELPGVQEVDQCAYIQEER
jgi:hypothetical protein